jgi:hypothetical protein
MGTLKYAVGSTLASASLFLAPAVPVAATTTNNSDSNNTTTTTVTETKTINIGDCVVRFDDIKVWLDQYNKIEADEQNNDVDGLGNDNNSQSNNSSASQSNSQSVVITVAPNCSVTNVQPAVAGGAGGQGGAVLGAQTESAKGGVGAGVGGAGSSMVASVGVIGSALGVGAGLLRRFGN